MIYIEYIFLGIVVLLSIRFLFKKLKITQNKKKDNCGDNNCGC
jgi:hypothetical protein